MLGFALVLLNSTPLFILLVKEIFFVLIATFLCQLSQGLDPFGKNFPLRGFPVQDLVLSPTVFFLTLNTYS